MVAIINVDVLINIWILLDRSYAWINEGELSETAIGLTGSRCDFDYSRLTLINNDINVNRGVAMLVLAKEEAVRTEVKHIVATIDNWLLEWEGNGIALNYTSANTEAACRGVGTSHIDVEVVAIIVVDDIWIDNQGFNIRESNCNRTEVANRSLSRRIGGKVVESLASNGELMSESWARESSVVGSLGHDIASALRYMECIYTRGSENFSKNDTHLVGVV